MKILQKIISRLANLTPNVFYYSNSLIVKNNDSLQKVAAQKGGKSSLLTLAALSLVCAATRELNIDDTMEINLTGVTDGNAEVGNFVVTISRLHHKGKT